MKYFWEMFSTTLGSAAVIAGIAMVVFSSKKRSELHKKNKTAHSILLAVVFGLLSVYASVSAVEINGALCNCRNLAPLYAGLVGGPIAGLGAALIGGLFRFFVYGGPSAIPCMLACFFAGIFGSVIHLVAKREVRYNILTGVCSSVIVEIVHYFLLIVFKMGYTAKIIIVPMMLSNVLGMAFCLYIYKCFDKNKEKN